MPEQLSILTLLERRQQIRIAEPCARHISITSARGQVAARVLLEPVISLDRLEAKLTFVVEQLAGCDADLKHFTHEQAASTRTPDRQAWAYLIALTLQGRMKLFAEQQRLQGLVAEAEWLMAA